MSDNSSIADDCGENEVNRSTCKTRLEVNDCDGAIDSDNSFFGSSLSKTRGDSSTKQRTGRTPMCIGEVATDSARILFELVSLLSGTNCGGLLVSRVEDEEPVDRPETTDDRLVIEL